MTQELRNEDGAPICPTCGVTMSPATLSAAIPRGADWVCLECEDAGESDATLAAQ
jgi:hypothetical protein